MQKTTTLLLVLFSTLSLYAQKEPMKLGKVELADLEMKYYPSDSTVDAAILCEYGRFDMTHYVFRHSRRIKIFSKEGLSHLIMTVPSESKSDVRGFVLNLVDGKIVKEKISKDHIFIERSGGRSQVRIAPPNVSEGSIVDIDYMYEDYPSIWQFQRDIPVRYSELLISENEYYSFRFQQIGYERIKSLDYGHYVAIDMPAFRAEPYVNSSDNYKSGILIDLTSIHISSMNSAGIFRSLAGTWDDVYKYYYKSDAFYGKLKNPDFFLNETVKEIEAATSDPVERLGLAVDAVQKKIEWNKVSDMVPDKSLRERWDEGSATAADMNFIFMILLRKLDITVNPLLISQRARGTVNSYFPTINKFNYVISCAEIGGNDILVDVSDKYSLPGMLPSRSINGGGFLISEDRGRWVDIEIDKDRGQMNSLVLVMDDKGSLKGKLFTSYSDYGEVAYRRSFDKFNTIDEYLEDFELDNPGIFVAEYSNNSKEAEHGKVNEELEIEIENYGNIMGDLMILNPVCFKRWTESPFKLESRMYPVDFLTPIKEVSMFNITFPEGYEIQEMPQSVSYTTQSKSIAFQYICRVTGNNMQLMVKLDINKAVFIQTEYPELLTLFNLIVQKQQENIILKKVT